MSLEEYFGFPPAVTPPTPTPIGAGGSVPVIPNVGGWGGGGTIPSIWHVFRETLNAQPPISQTQLAVCAADAPLRFAFGRNRVGAQILQPIVSGADLLLPFIIARGPIDAVEKIEFGNADPDPLISVTTYLGGTSQAIDPWLQAAWLAQGKVYADTLDGIAWGVAKIPSTVTGSILDPAITFRALKVYDPRDMAQTLGTPSTYKYTTNPALWLAAFINDPDYGRGEAMDWASVAALADINDQLVGGLLRRSGGIVFDTMRAVSAIEDTLRAYAGCFVVREPGGVRLIADAPAEPVYAFTNTFGSDLYVEPDYWDDDYCEGGNTPANYIADSIKINQRKRKDTPTVVSGVWTDTSVTPWQARTWTEPPSATRTAVGFVWREEQIQLPGIQDAGWARREVLRRLNAYITSDLTVTLIGTGEAVQLRRGDVVTLTDSQGITAKPFRLAGHKPNDLGLWDELLTEYDAAAYSDAVAAGPSNTDSTLPLPTQVPAVTGLTAVEELYATLDKTIRSRLRATWTAPANFPFPVRYLVEFWDGSSLVDSSIGTLTTYASHALQEGRDYAVKVSALWAAATGPASQVNLVAHGKELPPPDVATFIVEQFGREVLFRWSKVVDIDAIKRYEVRRWPFASGSGAWASGVVVDAVDALALRSISQPAGAWYYGIVAIDSTERASLHPNVAAFTVLPDETAYLVASHAFVTPTLVNAKAYANRDGVARYVTDFGDAWNTLFGGSPMSTFPDPVDSYHATGTSSVETEWIDIGTIVSGQWSAAVNYRDDAGAAIVYVELSFDGSTVDTSTAGGSAKGTGRYVRVRIETTGAMTVTGLPVITITANPRSETFAGTSSASGAVTVTLIGKYFALKDVVINPSGLGTALTGLWGNFVPSPTLANTIDVEIRDNANALVAADFTGTFYGIAYQ